MDNTGRDKPDLTNIQHVALPALDTNLELTFHHNVNILCFGVVVNFTAARARLDDIHMHIDITRSNIGINASENRATIHRQKSRRGILYFDFMEFCLLSHLVPPASFALIIVQPPTI
jgi:hypothetical protein